MFNVENEITEEKKKIVLNEKGTFNKFRRKFSKKY